MRLPGAVAQGILARAALAFLRIYLGLVIVLQAWSEIRGEPPTLRPVPVSWGELVVGVALVGGCFTRFSAAIVLVLSIYNLIEGGGGVWNPAGSDAALAAISIALLIGAAGRTAGLDALLARRWPRSPFW